MPVCSSWFRFLFIQLTFRLAAVGGEAKGDGMDGGTRKRRKQSSRTGRWRTEMRGNKSSEKMNAIGHEASRGQRYTQPATNWKECKDCRARRTRNRPPTKNRSRNHLLWSSERDKSVVVVAVVRSAREVRRRVPRSRRQLLLLVYTFRRSSFLLAAT